MKPTLTVSRDTVQLAVEFHADRDRMTHRLIQSCGGGPVVQLTSCDGDRSADWPPSPVVQQVDACQTGDGAESLVAVGMAGVSHWSLAVDVDSQRLAISFDIACRMKAPAEFLGSTYRLDGRVDQVNDRLVHLQSRTAKTPPFAAEALMGRLEIDQEGQLVLLPESIDVRPPTTVRWKYRFLIQ